MSDRNRADSRGAEPLWSAVACRRFSFVAARLRDLEVAPRRDTRQSGVRPPHSKARLRRAGFTLIEILIATLLMAAVVTGALLFLASSHAVEETVRRQISRNEQVQVAFEQFERALTTCLPPAGEYAEGLSATSADLEAEVAADDEQESGTRMAMVSAAGLGRYNGRLRRIMFRFAAGDEGPGRLVMNVASIGKDASGDQAVRLVDGLADVRFKFFDGAEWVSGVWDSAGRGGLPQLVRVELWYAVPPDAEDEEPPVDLPAGSVYTRTFRPLAAAAGVEEGGGRVIR